MKNQSHFGIKKYLDMKLEFDLQSPYQTDGSPRQDLPTGEVLGWNGSEWLIGHFGKDTFGRVCIESDYQVLFNIKWFAPLPTIYEDGNEVL